MALFEWTDTLSVQIDSIDMQHKKLVDLINQLHDAMRAGKGKDVLGATLDELINYTRYHFTYEEGLLKKVGYTDFVNHKSEHIKFTQQVVDLNEKYKSGNGMLTIEVMNFLKSWLNQHITGTDKKYAAQVKAKGIM